MVGLPVRTKTTTSNVRKKVIGGAMAVQTTLVQRDLDRVRTGLAGARRARRFAQVPAARGLGAPEIPVGGVVVFQPAQARTGETVTRVKVFHVVMVNVMVPRQQSAMLALLKTS
jgi:hypothetical protein